MAAMARDDGIIRKLSSEECWDLLRSTTFGRIGFQLRGRTRITPINYVVDGSRIVFRTAEGAKFFALMVEDNAVLEIDDYDAESAWSVIAHGGVREITDDPDAAAATAGLRPWVPTPKNHVFAIDVDKVRGRRFTLERPPGDV